MALEIIFTILLFMGLLLTVIPTFPGVPAMFGLVFIYGLIDSFQTLTAFHLAIFGALALLSLVIDYSSGLIGAKLGGANKRSMGIGLLGLFIGLIFLPPFGAFIGLFAGVFMSELIQFQDKHKALKAASFSLATTAIGSLINVGIAIGYLVGFLVIVI
jgi:uncharacterized protein YqgC (DUF456 family)